MRELDDARYKAIGARIRDVRLQRNMSQAELAEKAFISVPHMSEVENGKTKLRLSTFVYITEALQVSPDGSDERMQHALQGLLGSGIW